MVIKYFSICTLELSVKYVYLCTSKSRNRNFLRKFWKHMPDITYLSSWYLSIHSMNLQNRPVQVVSSVRPFNNTCLYNFPLHIFRIRKTTYKIHLESICCSTFFCLLFAFVIYFHILLILSAYSKTTFLRANSKLGNFFHKKLCLKISLCTYIEFLE